MTNTISPNKPLRSATRVQMITLVGVFAAISTILMFIEMPIPFMPPFLKIDLSGVPILIMGFMYGPLPAIYVTIIKDAIHMLSSQTGCVGELADMIILCSFSVVSSLLYRKNPSRKGVVISVLAGAATITVVGSLANKFMLIPFYTKVMLMPLEAIIEACHAVNPMVDSMNAYILFGAAPFNLIKGLILSVLTLLQQDVRIHSFSYGIRFSFLSEQIHIKFKFLYYNELCYLDSIYAFSYFSLYYTGKEPVGFSSRFFVFTLIFLSL